VSSIHGVQKSLVTLPYATIAADLAGATLLSCVFTYRCAHSYYNAGSQIYVGTHTNTTVPGSFPAANVRRWSTTGVAAGETVSLNLGTGIGTEFQNGTSKGFCFGPPPSSSLSYYGYLYTNPSLVISYKK
jgi:hypothetical protein